MNYERLAAEFGLLADPNRLKILELLGREGEQDGTRLLEALSIRQPTLSHHMKLLCQGGLVQGRRQGHRMVYRLDRAALARLLAPPPEEPAAAGAASESPRPVIVRSGHRW